MQCRNGPASFAPVRRDEWRAPGRQAAARKNGTPESLPACASANMLATGSHLADVGFHACPCPIWGGSTPPPHPQAGPQPQPPRLRVRCSRNCRSVQRATLGSHLARASAPKRPPMHDRRQPVASRWPESSSSRLQGSGRGLPTSGGDDFVRWASRTGKGCSRLGGRQSCPLPLDLFSGRHFPGPARRMGLKKSLPAAPPTKAAASYLWSDWAYLESTGL